MRKKLLLIGWDSADWKIIHPLLDALPRGSAIVPHRDGAPPPSDLRGNAAFASKRRRMRA